MMNDENVDFEEDFDVGISKIMFVSLDIGNPQMSCLLIFNLDSITNKCAYLYTTVESV